MFSAPGRGHDGVEQPGNIKHHTVGGQENRQDDEDDLKDAAREKCTHGCADCEDHANQGRNQRVLQVAPGASLYGVLLRHATKVAVLRSHPGPAGAVSLGPSPYHVDSGSRFNCCDAGQARFRCRPGAGQCLRFSPCSGTRLARTDLFRAREFHWTLMLSDLYFDLSSAANRLAGLRSGAIVQVSGVQGCSGPRGRLDTRLIVNRLLIADFDGMF
jgi:hypothetical protein